MDFATALELSRRAATLHQEGDTEWETWYELSVPDEADLASDTYLVFCTCGTEPGAATLRDYQPIETVNFLRYPGSPTWKQVEASGIKPGLFFCIPR